MSDDLSIQGTLAETTVADLVRSLIRSSETAVIQLDAIGRNDAIYFREGRIVFASSNDADLGLAEVLLRSGEIDLQQYNEATDSVSLSRGMGTVLMDRGFLNPEELTRAVERQVRTIVANALAFRSGSYTVDFTEEFPRDIITLHLNTERLVLDALHAIEFWSLISRGIGRLDRVIGVAPGADAKLYHMELTEEEGQVFAMFATPQTIEAACHRSYLSNFITCRTIWALLSVNMLTDAEQAEMSQQRAAAENEYELESFVEQYNAVFQNLFGYFFQTAGEQVYEMIDAMVGHLSPETLPYLSGVNLYNEGRVDFDQVLNNLIASGSQDSQAIVSGVLNELLYAWILEVKRNFGTQFEEDVNRIIAPLKKNGA